MKKRRRSEAPVDQPAEPATFLVTSSYEGHRTSCLCGLSWQIGAPGPEAMVAESSMSFPVVDGAYGVAIIGNVDHRLITARPVGIGGDSTLGCEEVTAASRGMAQSFDLVAKNAGCGQVVALRSWVIKSGVTYVTNQFGDGLLFGGLQESEESAHEAGEGERIADLDSGDDGEVRGL